MNLADYIVDVPDFPKEGIIFKDISTLMSDGPAFKEAIDQCIAYAKARGAEVVVGPEARGFIFGCPVSASLGLGFIPVRKPGKLPRATDEISYDLEYGSNTLCMHSDAIKPGQKVVIIDDILATGGTIKATIDLVEKQGGVVEGLCFLAELGFLNGRALLTEYDMHALITY